MTVEKSTLLRDVLFFIKNDLLSNITDPISSTRSTKSKFVVTSYPTRPTEYPVITIKATNVEAKAAGMQSTLQDISITLEIRVWARNEKEKDELYEDVFNRLNSIRFTTSTGSSANELHDFRVLSSVEIDEEGEPGKVIKSRIMQISYSFYNI